MDINQRYDTVRERLEIAAGKAGRSASDVTLVAVSKTFPASVISDHAQCGQVDFGENKIQELNSKQSELQGARVRWHFIGHLQRNKAKFLTEGVHLFHALDSIRLARELEKRLAAAASDLDCLLQVNVSGEESKFGTEPADVERLLTEIAAFKRICIRGLMTLAAPMPDPERVRPQFALLRELAHEHVDLLNCPKDGEPLLSMGMSGDFDVAVEEGATHIRVGSLLFGERG